MIYILLAISWAYFYFHGSFSNFKYNILITFSNHKQCFIAITNVASRTDFKLTKDIPHLVLVGDVWGVLESISKKLDISVAKYWLYYIEYIGYILL